MQKLGLSAADFRLYNRGLGLTHRREVTLQVLTLSGKPAGQVNVPITEGQVSVDVTQQPMSTLTLTLYDPTRSLAFDPRISDYPLHRSRMLRVTDSRHIPALGRWVPCVVFTGPMTKVDRDGPLVKVTAVDKSALAMDEAWFSREFPEGTRKDRVVRELLRDAGEDDAQMSVSKGKGTLGSKLPVKKDSKRWLLVRKVAKSGGREAFYTGPGVAIVRRSPGRSQWTVPTSMVLSNVRIDRTADRPPNTFQVIGGKPEGKNAKRVVSAPYYLPASHPDNPRPGSGIGRNGHLRRVPRVETNDKIKSKKVANFQARQMRNDVAKQAANVSVEIGPAPHLEPYDLVSVPTSDGTYAIRLQQFVLPLGVDGAPSMTLGTTRRVGAPTSRPNGSGGKRPSKGRNRNRNRGR